MILLSPLLFCPAEEVLSRAIFKLMNSMRILHMVSPKGYITPSHIFYVDDKFIFCRADNKSLQNLSIFLQKYGDFLVSMLTILKVAFSPWIILQDSLQKFNVIFLAVMTFYLLTI